MRKSGWGGKGKGNDIPLRTTWWNLSELQERKHGREEEK